MGGGYGKRIEETVEAHCNTVRAALLLHQTTLPPVKGEEKIP
jgi:hypothetical protein